ncbi:MAG TPA: YtcA family lipoprotein [Candidatus Binataceae bacterium]|nr:YtcA family lipoprotein [Candidatus Binataceae bacterium]
MLLRAMDSKGRFVLPLLLVTLAGCAPVIDLAGADFPAWMLCGMAGAVLTGVLRPLFVALRLEPHLGPLVVIYPCLALLWACLIWLAFFNRI